MHILIFLIVLPLLVITAQIQLGLDGVIGYSLYKLAFLIPPIVYCRYKNISIRRDILRFHLWRNGFRASILLGLLAVIVFWIVYYFFSDLLLDKQLIAAKMDEQFSVTAQTILLVAPFTIFCNSLLEEWFYRGFSFGLLVQKNRWLGYSIPTVAFTIQHAMFFTEWLEPIPYAIAIVGLAVFALVLQKLYEKTQTIVAPWITHIFGDIAMMGIGLTLVW